MISSKVARCFAYGTVWVCCDGCCPEVTPRLEVVASSLVLGFSVRGAARCACSVRVYGFTTPSTVDEPDDWAHVVSALPMKRANTPCSSGVDGCMSMMHNPPSTSMMRPVVPHAGQWDVAMAGTLTSWWPLGQRNAVSAASSGLCCITHHRGVRVRLPHHRTPSATHQVAGCRVPAPCIRGAHR